MDRMSRMGGIAALLAAATYVLGFVLLLSILAPAGFGDTTQEAAQQASVLVEHEWTIYVFYLIVYVLNAAALAVLVVALYARLKPTAPGLAGIATAFGLIWSGLVIASGMVANVGIKWIVDLHSTNPEAAGAAWTPIYYVVEGLGGGNEIVGGLWVLFLSFAALASGALPRLLCILGLLISAAGLATAIPVLSEPGGAVFGVGMILWFTWVGVALLRQTAPVDPRRQLT